MTVRDLLRVLETAWTEGAHRWGGLGCSVCNWH